MFQAKLKSTIEEDICLLVQLDNHSWNYLCECGDASGLTVKECQDTQAIFISHTHLDHFVNFDWILRHQLGIEREVVICGPKHIARQVQCRLQSYTWNLIESNAITYQVREIVDEETIKVYALTPPLWELKEMPDLSSNTIFKEELFQVNFTILDHKIPSIAYRFQEIDTIKIDIGKSGFSGGKWVRELKSAYERQDPSVAIEVEGRSYQSGELFHLLFEKRGDSLGVIMDHGANEANHAKIQSLFTGCRQVFIECFFLEKDRDLAELHDHSYSTQSGRIMKACQVEEAIPVHFSRKYEAVDIERLEAEFENAYIH